MAKIDVKVPDIGDFKDVPVIEVLVKPGDAVKVDQSLVTLESDKATMDVPSPVAGTVADVVAKVGDKVSMGVADRPDRRGRPMQPPRQRRRRPRSGGRRKPTAPPARAASAPRAGGVHRPLRHWRRRPAKPDFSGVFAGPAVRRLARELDVDLNTIKGTGEKGRITARTSRRRSRNPARRPQAAAPCRLSRPSTSPNSARSRPFRSRASSAFPGRGCMRRGSTCRTSPTRDEADITELEAFRKSLDEDAKKDKSKPYRVSLLPLLMRAAVATLKAFPTFNAALSPAGDALIMRRYWHIGVAVDTPDGLVVAVVKDVDQKGVVELARELGALSEKARAGKLAPAEMQGATFTISSLGGIGGTAFTPIVNAPEVAILGVVRSRMAPVWDGEAFRAAADAAALPLLRSPRHRRRRGGALHAPSGGRRRGHAARHPLTRSGAEWVMAQEIRLPDIGDFKDVPIIEILIAPGQSVRKEATILTLESDKATIDVPAPEDGVIGEVHVKVGDKVSQGDLLATYASAAAQPAAAAVCCRSPARRARQPRRLRRCARVRA